MAELSNLVPTVGSYRPEGRFQVLKGKELRFKAHGLDGDAWHFEYDSTTDAGILRGSEAGWQPYRVINGHTISLMLAEKELIRVAQNGAGQP